MHLQVDAPPHVLDDRIGLQLAEPDPDWRQRPDMNRYATPGVRASIVARARFIEDLVAEQADHGVGQYVLLGAGLDTFAQRRPEIASRITVFEVDQPGPQAWKRHRLVELGFDVPDWLRLVPVDFETTPGGIGCWPTALTRTQPAVLRQLGVSMYLTSEATVATLRQIASLAPGSTLAMTFLRPLELVEPDEQAITERRTPQRARRARRSSATTRRRRSWRWLVAPAFPPREVTAVDYTQRYFADRTDGLRPFTTEELLVATT